MTTPIDPTTPSPQPKAESFVDWFHLNSRWITVGAVVAGLAIFAVWFVQRKALNETMNSDRQLLVAKQSLNSGNAALGESDLKKVLEKYPNKPAGAEAGMLLAQLRLDKGDAQGAVAVLQDLSGKVTSGPNAGAVRGLYGDALTQLEKYAEAAAKYQSAAGATTMANEQAFWNSRAARAYLWAGKTPEGRKLYEALAAQTDNEAIATEAHVRLGELTVGAKP